ncbi:MAG: hypothetical protein L3J71_12225 [Victivallaceae bacterium]|nr:hypothetical protein [Victivallaceae bacterium]
MTLIILICSIIIIAKAAELEGRSSVSWGFITFLICIACGFLIPLPLINIVIGLFISFIALFAVKVIKK